MNVQVMLQIFCNHFGLASINPITNTNYNKVIREENRLGPIYSNERGDWDLTRLKSPKIVRNYDFDDYNRGGEELDNSVQYYDENTQTVHDDFNENDYTEDEFLMSADKRSRHAQRQSKKRTDKLVDLCPTNVVPYAIADYWKMRGFKLQDGRNYTEIVCNHTTTHDAYERQYNRICYSLGRTFEFGQGTHCFQRYISRNIDIESVHDSKNRRFYQAHFRQGCTCGWATDELGSIEDYHDYKKILSLCSELGDRD
ncbi:hypothetical protein HA402_009885 [Bradysia odoriphaga]|nr:hypothetical protein HA402_009885 [Bradysia odoriphaga]